MKNILRILSKMIDNFEQIKSLMKFENNNEFFYLQILQRRKDNNEDKLDRNVRLIKSYYISSIKHLDEIKDEIIGLCKYFNARAYINLNKRNYEKCALQTARLILDQVANKDFKSSKKAFNSACGRYSSDSDKKWILDYDNGMIRKSQLKGLRHMLKHVQPTNIEDKIIDVIPTKNGCHIITKPFNIKESKEVLDALGLDVHKNNPSLLYCR